MKNIFTSLKTGIMDYLAKMERANKNLYGNIAPNCCDLNSSVKKDSKHKHQ